MIGKLTGRIDYVAEDHVLIETLGGVGYELICARATLAALPGPGAEVTLYTEMVVREDAQQLLGFRTRLEREWHRLLASVQGVGAKASLAILGSLGTEGVARALTLGDATALRKAPGIGPKIATRIATELKDKAPKLMARAGEFPETAPRPSAAVLPAAQTTQAVASVEVEAPPAGAAMAEAVSALVNLGIAESDAAAAVASVADSAAETSGLIRAALKSLDRTA
ncbi:MAG: Holliday junction branch migration protein RuvA [Pseudomonadota bacterium]